MNKIMSEKEIMQVFHMKGGTDEMSYSKSAYLAKEILSRSKSIREKAIKDLYYTMEHPTTLCIAELGCSSCTENTLGGALYGLIETVDKARREVGVNVDDQEYHIYLNDLPGNDFNTVFRSLTMFKDKLNQQLGDDYGHCFVNGVPGSFYGRLFPTNTLHFVHSSTSLHWLSQVPEEIEENKRNIFMAKASPKKVISSYYEQFTKDFSMFLHCRSKEVASGGKMVLNILGRQNNDSSFDKESGSMGDMLEPLASALNDMVTEGYIEEEKLNTFNIPIYTPSPMELEYLVANEGSFALNEVHLQQVISWDPKIDSSIKKNNTNRNDILNLQTSCMRAVFESLVVSHFGEEVMDEIFRRFKENLYVSMSKEEVGVTNITIYLTRRGRAEVN